MLQNSVSKSVFYAKKNEKKILFTSIFVHLLQYIKEAWAKFLILNIIGEIKQLQLHHDQIMVRHLRTSSAQKMKKNIMERMIITYRILT